MRSALRRLPSFLGATATLGALAVLARFRPELRDAPDSLSSPVTTAFLQALSLIAAWLLAALVVLLLLVQSLRGIRASRKHDRDLPYLPVRMREPSRLPRLAGTHTLLHPLIVEPRFLVAAPREVPPPPLDELCIGSSGRSVYGALADADPRPLISLLGPLTIHGGKRSRRGLRARALELIAFLALRREGAQRDEILEALWPGGDPKRTRHGLYQAVRDARQLLGSALMSERDRYWLDRSQVRVDADELEEMLDEAARADTRSRRGQLGAALELFRDEPLAGCDFAWCEGDVRRLRGTYVELLEEVGRATLGAGEARAALHTAERGLAVDTLNESLWRLAMEAESALGLREAVAERYERLRALLDERLGLEPARETRLLHRSLLAQT